MHNRTTTSVPSRPAPAPPPLSTVATGNPHRYTPTTNWDDSPFDVAGPIKKVPPPRPPPPKATDGGASVPFKKATPQSVNILSNLFGRSTSSSSKSTAIGSLKLPPPPPSLKKHHHGPSASTISASKFNTSQVGRVSTVPLQSASMSSGVYNVGNSALPASSTSTAELIDWSSPPSSPTLTHKTNSDCLSMDSFSSDTNSNSSPQNGSYSQAESGFEDDFGVQITGSSSGRSTSYQEFKRVSNQITLMDPFSAPPPATNLQPKIRTVPPPIAQKPKLVEQSAFYTQNSISFQAKPFDDPLSNGKSLIAPPQQNAFSMPTIIKPVISAKPIGIPQATKKKAMAPTMPVMVFAKRDSSTDEEKTPSPPMPSCPPPPPPAEYFAMSSSGGGTAVAQQPEEAEEGVQSYGIALYDYESEVDGDLNFRANDKIYLMRQENEEWMYGRCKRGCEGIFPVNYVDIKVPLRTNQPARSLAPVTVATTVNQTTKAVVAPKPTQRRCRAMYDFNAEADEDLSIKEGEIITIIEEINEEWLMGRKSNGCQGQFPVAFVEYL